jgi:hypothetical protein
VYFSRNADFAVRGVAHGVRNNVVQDNCQQTTAALYPSGTAMGRESEMSSCRLICPIRMDILDHLDDAKDLACRRADGGREVSHNSQVFEMAN